jgi:hypothetical protein
MEYCMIDSDKWDDLGKVYKVVQYSYRPNSTGVELQLEYNGETLMKVVPLEQINWIK